MKEYYYLSGKDQNGPFTLEELLEKKDMCEETLIWSDGMANWQKLKELPELKYYKTKTVPPPIPIYLIDESINTDDTDQVKKSKEIPNSPFCNYFRLSKKALIWLIIWCSFHFFALLMSYSQVHFFNNERPLSDKFWPFVSYNNCADRVDLSRNIVWDKYYHEEGLWMNLCFNGIFAYYDWSEFVFYIGVVIIILFFRRISRE